MQRVALPPESDTAHLEVLPHERSPTERLGRSGPLLQEKPRRANRRHPRLCNFAELVIEERGTRDMAEPYPPTELYDHGMLDVGDVNLVYWETRGNPDGKHALVVHGGPGSSCETSTG